VIGIDILDIDRVDKLISQPYFDRRKIFNDCEWAYYVNNGCNISTLAGLWCAKESFGKALGCGIVGFGLCDVCVLHTQLGQPYIETYNNALTLLGTRTPYLSISHTDSTVIAVCVLL
jgi:holo-[acyl-carrier protein] synthase